MTWFKVDDSFYRSRKVRRLGTDRVPAVGLWTLCGDWAADNLTDGFVPWEVVQDWDSGRRLAGCLIEAALWFETEHDGETGIRFHDWHDWQPTREQVIQRRKADAERRARWREARRNGVTPDGPGGGSHQGSLNGSRPESQGESRRDSRVLSRGGSRTGSALPDPTRPDPTISTKNTPPLAPLADPLFETFYKTYPRREDRRSAERAWKAAIKRGASAAAITAAACRYASLAASTERRFIKLPASWLNAAAYDNEPPADTDPAVTGERRVQL